MPKTFTLMLVHAHPDDECSSTGGLILKSAGAGHRVILITCTNGEMGKMEHLDVKLDPDSEADQNRLGEIRIEELKRAARILQISAVHTLGYRDSGMDGWAGNGHPAAFRNADPEEAVGRIVGYIRRYRPDVVVTYNEQGGYGHPDHVMAHKVTTEAIGSAADPARFPENGGAAWRVPKLYYTAWSRSKMLRTWRWMKCFGQKTPLDDPDFREDRYGTPDELITTRVDIRRYLRRKWQALTAHRSQIDGNFFWWFIRMTGRWLYNEESFVCAEAQVETRAGERSVFEGLSGSA